MKVIRDDHRMAWHYALFLIGFFAVMHSAAADIPAVNVINSPLINANGNALAGIIHTGLAADATFIYQAGFDKSTWSGSLKKVSMIVAGNGNVQVSASPAWDAAAILTGPKDRSRMLSPETRKIYTAKVAAGDASGTVEFFWKNLSASQQAFLNAAPDSGKLDGLGQKRVEFLRGKRQDESGQPQGIFRQRTSILGDIINSKPVYVGAPAQHNFGHDYLKFYEIAKERPKLVYVGANDGMMHGFDAADGAELFAYVPNALMEELGQLSRMDYVHRPYVDGAMTVAEAKVQGNWKTVLVSGMGGGAQGVFALDVTNPADFQGGLGALWEFTDRDDPDMGNVFNVPVIAKFKVELVNGIAEYRHFAVVGNGFNSYVDDGDDRFNPQASAVLFLLSLDKRPSDRWKSGVNYFKFKKPIVDPGRPNGLSAPALVTGAEGAVRFAYAGDLQGNLWRFDFDGNKPWVKENSEQTPLFTAMDDDQVRQPITVQPSIVFASGSGYVVLFGTGKFAEEADTLPAAFGFQSFYGIHDNLERANFVSGRAHLEARLLTEDRGDALSFAGKAVNYGVTNGAKKGWYFDFYASNKTGERSVSNPVTTSGQLIFNSLIPCGTPCTQRSGRSYVLNPLTGLPVGQDDTGWLLGLGWLNAPVVVSAGNEVGSRNAFGKAIVKKKQVILHSGTGGADGAVAAGQGSDAGSLSAVKLPAMRFSWREVVNWQELRSRINKRP